jgi:hypothetical protein
MVALRSNTIVRFSAKGGRTTLLYQSRSNPGSASKACIRSLKPGISSWSVVAFRDGENPGADQIGCELIAFIDLHLGHLFE